MATKKSTPEKAPAQKTGKRNGKKSQIGHSRRRLTLPKPQEHAMGDWAPAYLAALERTGRQLDSMKAAGVKAFSTITRRRQSDPVFLQLEGEAMLAVKAIFEDELRRRAIEGVESFTYDKDGNKRTSRIEYSDTLLLRWLERQDPTWRSKQELTVENKIPPTREARKARLEMGREKLRQPLS